MPVQRLKASNGDHFIMLETTVIKFKRDYYYAMILGECAHYQKCQTNFRLTILFRDDALNYIFYSPQYTNEITCKHQLDCRHLTHYQVSLTFCGICH